MLALLFTIAYGWPRTNGSGGSVKRTLSPTFARVYGLITLAILAVTTVLLTSNKEVLTGVFTLFGTIAGYLAGSKAEQVGGTPPTAPDAPTTQATVELN
ncbi:hypothetical protein G7085_17525 [Tessaracoccus sp. HDW20]|uniref:hypothetical protein n=1 Tax=Tessaracoccus coleopterorum TaxID=2714950 RepID=UPI0018D287F0|nr:hypothetical protein [Tessaracoccus coleopterorum]NHB85771.1 hypothetical protein [Tessaracoccus coleopterorum]